MIMRIKFYEMYKRLIHEFSKSWDTRTIIKNKLYIRILTMENWKLK